MIFRTFVACIYSFIDLFTYIYLYVFVPNVTHVRRSEDNLW